MTSAVSRITLITGANKGIGFEIARQLGAAGHTVLVGARDAGRGEAAAAELRKGGLDAHFIRLDVTDQATIDAAVAHIDAAHGRLDVLVNNAGISRRGRGDGLPTTTNVDATREIFETNFFGVLALTNAMLPLLRKSAAARIVNLSSTLGSLARNSDPEWAAAGSGVIGYGASKAALNLLTIQLATELAPFGIKVNSADPGFTATDLNGHRGTQTVAEGAASSVRLAQLPDDGPTGGFFSAAGPLLW